MNINANSPEQYNSDHNNCTSKMHFIWNQISPSFLISFILLILLMYEYTNVCRYFEIVICVAEKMFCFYWKPPSFEGLHLVRSKQIQRSSNEGHC